MEEAILEIVRGIQDQKKDDMKFPTHALKQEVFRKVSNALNSLFEQGKITVGNTINDKYIKVNE